LSTGYLIRAKAGRVEPGCVPLARRGCQPWANLRRPSVEADTIGEVTSSLAWQGGWACLSKVFRVGSRDKPMRVQPPNPGLTLPSIPPNPGIALPTTPPNPGLLAAAVKLGFLVTSREASRELGVMVDGSGVIQHLTVQSGGRDGTWTLVDTLPEDFGHFLLTRETFTILQRGTLTQEGDIAFEGETYQLRAAINGGQLTAKAIRLDKGAG
jgi:hypothetical protein